MSEWKSVPYGFGWANDGDPSTYPVQHVVDELQAELKQVEQTAINFHDAWQKAQDELEEMKHEFKNMEECVTHYEVANASLQRQADQSANCKMKLKIAQEHIERLRQWQAVEDMKTRNQAFDEASAIARNYQSGSKMVIIGAGLIAGAIQRLKS